jgi:hypothetical protein
MNPVGEPQHDQRKGEYRTTARVQMDERHLLLRGGRYDGQHWSGVVGIGDKCFCGGADPWSMAGMYVVTALVEESDTAGTVSIAVPLFAQ